jgi:CobQ/CobB/MinD/ParA nucleotide binding domain
MTKRLDLIFNGKGGVGKSFFAVNFVQYLKDKNIKFVACDCDNENSTLKRFHGDDVQFLDLSHPRGLDAMIHALDKTDLVVVDCRAASTDAFFNYFDEIDLQPTLKDLSAALTLIMPINQEADSIYQLNRATEKLGSACSYVVLRNTVHSDSFPLFENTVIRKRLLRELGAKEITMAKMQPWLVEELSHKNLTITAAVADGQAHLLDRRRLLTWQRKFYAQIESVADLLLPMKS